MGPARHERTHGFFAAAVVQPHAFPSSMQLNGRKKSKQDNNELEKKWKQVKNG
jgi:hypothetical protein